MPSKVMLRCLIWTCFSYKARLEIGLFKSEFSQKQVLNKIFDTYFENKKVGNSSQSDNTVKIRILP